MPVNTVRVRDVVVGGGHPVLIAGPCLAESWDVCARVAETLKRICATLSVQYIFKASFDKANRSSLETPRGAGMDEGLRILQRVQQEFDLPLTTDVHLPDQAASV